MEALYTIDLIRHLPLSGHSNLVLQLHSISSVLAVGYMRKAGHSPCTAYPMHPTTPPNRKKQRTRKRNITSFNSPYNIKVKTNVGKKFFYLINKHFPPNNRLHKICNKFNVKLSYSCMPNMARIIKSHNNKLLIPFGAPAHHWLNISFVNSIAWLQYRDIVLAS